jgi:uncharacterized RDD family membrane protein YckC
MEPFALVNQAIDVLVPRLPAVITDVAGSAARTLFETIAQALREHNEQDTLDKFVSKPTDNSKVKGILRQIVRQDPAFAAELANATSAVAFQITRPAPAEGESGDLVPAVGWRPDNPIIPHRVSAAPNPALTLPPAALTGFGGVPVQLSDRFLARLIDGGILLTLLLVAAGVGRAFESAPVGLFVGPVYLVLLGYEFYMIGRYGQTIGKRVMRIRVVTLTGGSVGWGASAARSFVYTLASACTCGLLGLLFDLSPLFDSSPWKRGWRDQVASTVVVRST